MIADALHLGPIDSMIQGEVIGKVGIGLGPIRTPPDSLAIDWPTWGIWQDSLVVGNNGWIKAVGLFLRPTASGYGGAWRINGENSLAQGQVTLERTPCTGAA